MMTFKTAVILTFSTLPPLTDEKLEAFKFVPCAKQEPSRAGFVEPYGFDTLVGETPDRKIAVICLQVEEKILPAAVVNHAVTQRVDNILHTEDRRPGRKERQDIKDEVTFELLPRAFSKYRRTHAIIDYSNHLIIVAGGFSRADEVTTMLREALGSLPATLINTMLPPATVMTDWLSKDLPAGVTVGDYCKLEDRVDDAILISRHDDPRGQLISKHIDAGRQVVELALFLDPLSFVLTSSLALKAINFTDLAIDDALEGIEDKHQEAQASLLLYADTFSSAIKTLTTEFGGYQQPELRLQDTTTNAAAR